MKHTAITPSDSTDVSNVASLGVLVGSSGTLSYRLTTAPSTTVSVSVQAGQTVSGSFSRVMAATTATGIVGLSPEWLALPALYDRVKAYLEAESSSISVVCGPFESAKQNNQGGGLANRVVFAPADENGSLGTYGAPKYPGRNPRPIANLAESCRVLVWAHDPTRPTAWIAQYVAARMLHDDVVRAIHLCALGVEVESRIAYKLSSPKLVPVMERQLGVELQFLLTIDAMIADAPHDEVEVEESNVEQQLKPPDGDVTAP